MTDKKLVPSTNGGRNFETGDGFAAGKNISRGIRDFKTGGVTAVRNFGSSTDSGFKTVKRISRGGGFAADRNISRGIRDFKTGAGFAADKSFVRVDSDFETSDGVTAIRNFGGSTNSGFKTVKRISRGGGFAAVKNISRGASEFKTGGGISERYEEG